MAHDLAAALLRTHDVPDVVYEACLRVFGESGTIAILSLIAQYQMVSSLLVCFRVPAP
ncbi:hypothetical protein [Allobranchiibius sp. GilTou73]|uniref:hypothetical protein n=1 Tax=Allobranchiibius sp. GilTou73 TaxID=2904523 RepID=UPI001F1B4FE3|nr:hypothetical protein [Allobranchiibius sp. GilTou73]UIJ33710.1 hypothetical protein LVQ62_11135 [Allobranchiibius sp. GilTou73]